MTGKQFIGFCKAKKKFYYGFKIHMITTASGKPVEFIITPASIADITAFKTMEIDLPFHSVIYGDKPIPAILLKMIYMILNQSN